MQSEIEQAYNDSKTALKLWERSAKEYVGVLEGLAKNEANLDSVTAQVTKEFDDGRVSKAALKNIVAGNDRVLTAKAEVMRLKRSKEAYLCRIDYLKAQYDLEKKRMSAEMEECKRMDFNRTP